MATTIQAPYPPNAFVASAPTPDPVKVIYVTPEAEDSDTCECTAGWWMFGLGWWLTVPWAVGMCLPLCDKGSRPNVRRNNRRAAIGSAVMLLLITIAMVAIIVMFAMVAGKGAASTSKPW
jgi:hypothetical protein